MRNARRVTRRRVSPLDTCVHYRRPQRYRPYITPYKHTPWTIVSNADLRDTEDGLNAGSMGRSGLGETFQRHHVRCVRPPSFGGNCRENSFQGAGCVVFRTGIIRYIMFAVTVQLCLQRCRFRAEEPTPFRRALICCKQFQCNAKPRVF